MFNLHIFSRFFRLVRSIRRSLFAFFVTIAMLLATFVIAPTSALSAGESAGANTVSTENTGDTKSDSAKTDGEKKQPEQSEPNNTELNKKNTGSSDTLKKNDNKESKPVEKQTNAGNNGVDKAKADSAVKKNVKKQAAAAKAVNGTDRGADEKPQLPKECKKDKRRNTFATCYTIKYKNVTVASGGSFTAKAEIKVPGHKKKDPPVSLPKGTRIELSQSVDDGKKNAYDFAFFKDKDNNYTVKSIENVDNNDLSIYFKPSKFYAGDYSLKVIAHYPADNTQSEKSFNVTVTKTIGDKDLSLNLYDFVNKQDKTPVKDNKITINPKSNSQGSSGSDTGSTDKKDTYDSINKLFIDSQSEAKPGFIYHRMICKTGSGDKASYTVDSVNGLNLSTQQFTHKENLIRPKDSTADNSAVYEDDKYTEKSQSWISGKPSGDGTFVCKVFAFKNANLVNTGEGKHFKYSTVLDEFNTKVKDDAGKKSLFEGNIVDSTKWKTDDIKQGVDWAYESVTIEVKSSNPPKPEPPKISDNDLTLKVYPFKDSTTALTSDNNKISAILGMSLKPFVDATSAADSANKITLRVLCSKGENKENAAGGSGASTGGADSAESGSAGSGSSGGTAVDGSTSSAQSGSQSEQPSKQSQDAKDLEYKTWSSNLAELGLSVPADTDQNTCNSKEGEKTCASADSKTNVAARTDKEVSIKPTEVGDYQCVVFALKPKALTKFDGLTGSSTQAGNLTPDSIKSALTSAEPTTATPTAFKEHKDFAAFTLNIHLVSKFTLPHTGGQSWNLQLGILAALLVNLLAAGFVVSQSERGRKLILGRWRGLCNHV